MIGRRELLIGTVGGLVGSLALPRLGRSQAETGIVPLNPRLSLVTSGGTNIVALSTEDGLVVVDSGTPELSDALMTPLRRLASGRPIGTVFNTHWHEDHTGANETLRQSGATIVAHTKTRQWMATPTWMPDENRYRLPRAPMARPTETFHVEGSMKAGGERIDYGYLIEAHTSGDIYVFFRDSNVLAVGDVASPTRDPELDYVTGAWIGGRVDAMSRLLELCDEATRIVPGHGPVMRRADLEVERDMMETIYERTVDRVRQGDSALDMLDAGVMAGLTRTFDDPSTFLYAVHKGLWAHHDKLSPDVV